MWVWRRRARFLAKWAAILGIVFSGLAAFLAYSVYDVGAAWANDSVWQWVWLYTISPPAYVVIGVLILEKVVREYVVRRKTLNKGIREGVDGAYSKAVEVSEASARAAKTWVADGFKEEEDKRSADEQK